MKTICPSCGSTIPLNDINVSTDIALCRACGRTSSLSQIVDSLSENGADLAAPPSGAWFEQSPNSFRVGASTRSWMALFLVPFTCVWAGGSVGNIYGQQITSGKFDLFSSLFGLPFLIGSCALGAMSAMAIAGKIEVTRRDNRLMIFAGVGSLGWSRSHAWTDFSTAMEGVGRNNGMNWNPRGQAIVLEGKRRVAFGSMLSEDRRYFILSALQKMLRQERRSVTGLSGFRK